MDDPRFTQGLLTMSETSRYLGIPRRTVNRWAAGESGLLHTVPAGRRRANMPLIAIAEAWVLDGLRRAGVHLSRVKPAIAALRREFDTEYILTAKELATDGISVLWDFSRSPEGEGLLEPATNQHLIREVIDDYVRYLGYDDDQIVHRVQLRRYEPAAVFIDPTIAFGLPTFEGRRLRVGDVASYIQAGEDDETIAEELGLDVRSVLATRRVLVGAS